MALLVTYFLYGHMEKNYWKPLWTVLIIINRIWNLHVNSKSEINFLVLKVKFEKGSLVTSV